MEYLKVRWHHEFPEEPVLLYSELDAERYETRKVEVYRSGRHDWADAQASTGTTLLGELPVPSFVDIAGQSEFAPEVIDRKVFEEVWLRATAG